MKKRGSARRGWKWKISTADVQELGLRVDRLQSRTERLRQRLQKLRG